MKIKKSQLEKIINEEVVALLEEGVLGDTASDAWGGLKNLGREFAKGFMGNLDKDNPLSKGTYRAFGSTLVPDIDRSFEKILKRLSELKNHDEGKKLTQPQKDTEGKPISGPDQPMTLEQFQTSLNDLINSWVKMTNVYRHPSAEGEGEDVDDASSDDFDGQTGEPLTDAGREKCAQNPACKEKWLSDDDGPEQLELPLSEVIRRQVRKHLMFRKLS